MARELLYTVKVEGTEEQRNRIGEIVIKIKELQAEFKNLTDAEKKNEIKVGDHTKAINLLKTEKNELLKTIRELTKAKQTESDGNKIAADSIIGLRKALSDATRQYDLMSAAERKSAAGADLEKSIASQVAALNTLEQKTGRFQRNVGNYASGWNGLANSINQVTREMPNFAQSATIGFMALSNNLPILADEINRVRLANAALAAEGKATVSVWKQMATAIFSWQSALITAISLSVIYAKELSAWVKGTKEVDEATKKLSETIGQDIAQTKMLVGIIENTNIATDKRIIAARELIKLYPKTLENYSAEEIAAGKASEAIDRITNSIISYAKIKAIQSDIDAEAVKQWQNEKTIADLKTTISKKETESALLSNAAKTATGNVQDRLIKQSSQLAIEASRAAKELNKLTKENEESNKKMTELSEKASGLLPNVLSETITKPDKGGKTPKEKIKEEEDLTSKMLDLRRQYQDELIALDADQFNREKNQEEMRHQRAIEDYEALQKQFPELKAHYDNLINSEGMTHAAKMEKILSDSIQRQIEIQKKGNEIQLKQEEDKDKEWEKLAADFFKQWEKETEADQKAKEQKKKQKAEEDDRNRKVTIDAAVRAAQDVASAVEKVEQRAIDRRLKRELTAIQRNADAQDRILQNRLENGLISEAQYQAAKFALNEKTAAEELAADKKAFEQKKKLDTRMAIINTALAVTSILAYSKDATGTQTLVRIAAALVAGIAAIAVIQKQQFKKGGRVSGRSHAEGGVDIEAEGGELIVNKQSARSQQVMSVTGTPSQIVSAVNSTGGFGVNFDSGAITNYPNPNMFRNTSSTGLTRADLMEFVTMQAAMINDKDVSVVEHKITRAQKTVALLESSGKW